MSKNNYSCELCLDLKWVGNEKSVGSLDFGKLIPCQCQKEQISKDREEILSKNITSNLGDISLEKIRTQTFENFDHPNHSSFFNYPLALYSIQNKGMKCFL